MPLFFFAVSGLKSTIGPGSVVKLRRWSKNKGELVHAQARGQSLSSQTGVEVRPQGGKAETQISVCRSLNAPKANTLPGCPITGMFAGGGAVEGAPQSC